MWQNNLFYNTSNVGFSLNGASLAEDHNSWLNSGSPRSGQADVTVTGGAPNPFVAWPNADFRLVGQNAAWQDGATEVAPYNVDKAGSARPGFDGLWDRGAFEFAGTQTTLPMPPSGLTASVK